MGEMSSWKRSLLLIVVVNLAFAATAIADTVSLAPKKDNTIYSESQYTNGGGQHFFAGTTLHNYRRRSLISFDVSASVPAGSNIQSATLRLHMSRTNPLAHPITVSLHRCLAAWGEGTAVGLLGEGGGGPPGPGDATWTYNSFDTGMWSAPGGDYASTPSGSTSVSDIDFYTWPSTPGLVADVQSWLDSPQTNFGWVVVSAPEAQGVITSKRFDSRENLSPEFRPVLEIVYAPSAFADAGMDAGRNDDAGVVDSGSPDGGVVDAGLPDAGIFDAGSDGKRDAEDNPLKNRRVQELGGGCQTAPGFLAIFGLVLFALTRAWRSDRRTLSSPEDVALLSFENESKNILLQH
jgi:hypothetical protein